MTLRVRLRRDDSRRPRLVKAVADQLASALGVTENRVRVYASQGMPHWEGVDACRTWLRNRRSGTSLLMQPTDVQQVAGTAETRPQDSAADSDVSSGPPPDDLAAQLQELPPELKAMSPRDAYEWLRVLKLQRQLRTEDADRISRAQALDLLVERARHLRQTMLAIPRRLGHALGDEGLAALTKEIRGALATYAAPEGYLDRLMPAGHDGSAP